MRGKKARVIRKVLTTQGIDIKSESGKKLYREIKRNAFNNEGKVTVVRES